jgi:CelD/BcsL family acetyltransferase involved in cellulose biosynthesis
MTDMQCVLGPTEPAEALESAWRDLEQTSSSSFFCSWMWLGTWLSNLPSEARPLTVRLLRGRQTAGLGLVGHRTGRRAVFAERRALLNATGDKALDSITTEHNGLVGETNWPLVAGCVMRQFDEFTLPGVSGALPREKGEHEGFLRVARAAPAYRVRLEAVRACGGDLDYLSRNAREKLRQSGRKYESFGGIALDEAPDVRTALTYFSALKELHVASWTRRERRHSFEFPFFEQFHRDLISRHHASGATELLRVRAGTKILGYLYNFRYRGTVYAYQSGFDDIDPRLRPGYVCHALAIARHAAAGAETYDFMAGHNRLKQSFANQTYEMIWHRFRRPLILRKE